jgi:hypothetical protein
MKHKARTHCLYCSDLARMQPPACHAVRHASYRCCPFTTPRMPCRAVGGTTFDLAARYGEVLNVSTVAFVFASAMPLLLPVLALAIGAAYWLQLADLLFVSKRPAQQIRPKFG